MHSVHIAIVCVSLGLGLLALGTIIYLLLRRQCRASMKSALGDSLALCALEAGMLTRERAVQSGCARHGNVGPCTDLAYYYPPCWNITEQALHPVTFGTQLGRVSEPTVHVWRPVPDQWKQTCATPAARTVQALPGWTHHNVTLQEQIDYIQTQHKNTPALTSLLQKIKEPKLVTALWRLVVAYDKGGLVLNANDIVHKVPSDLNAPYLYVTQVSSRDTADHLFGHGAVRSDLFLTSPRHPAILAVLNQVCANLEQLAIHEDHRFLRLHSNNPDSQDHRISCCAQDIPFSMHILDRKDPSVHVLPAHFDGMVAGLPEWGSIKCSRTKGPSKATKLMVHDATETKVPPIVHLTWKSRDKVPQKVWDHLETVVPSNFEYRFYSDEDCEQYMEERFGSKITQLYRDIPSGAHRADTFRYAVLYDVGGVWLDIKNYPKVSLDRMFDLNLDFTTSITPTTGLVHQGVISAAPKLALLYECFFDSLKYGNPATRAGRTYITNLKFMADRLMETTRAPLKIGVNQGNRFDFKLIEERVRKGGTDRYGFDSQMYDENGVHVAKTRYDDFPWN